MICNQRKHLYCRLKKIKKTTLAVLQHNDKDSLKHLSKVPIAVYIYNDINELILIVLLGIGPIPN